MPDTTHEVLTARELVVVLPGDDGLVRVLDGAELRLSAGEIVDIAGPSGSGKTTLLRTLARLMPHAHAELRLSGVPAEQIPAEQWRAAVSLLPQRTALTAGSVESNLLFPWTLKVRRDSRPPSHGELRSALDDVGLGDVSLERDAARLSVGQQARVALLRVLLTAPKVLLLDEPDAALDPASADALSCTLAAFGAAGGAIVRARHRGSDGLATRRLSLHGGQLAEEAAS